MVISQEKVGFSTVEADLDFALEMALTHLPRDRDLVDDLLDADNSCCLSAAFGLNRISGRIA